MPNNEPKPHEQMHLPEEDTNVGDGGNTPSDNVQRIDKNLIIKNFYGFNETEAFNMKGQKFARTVVQGASYTVAAQDFLIAVTRLPFGVSVGLPKPSLVGPGKYYIVKDEAGGAATSTITVTSEGEATIDGASSSTIITNYGSKEYYTNGISWFTK